MKTLIFRTTVLLVFLYTACKKDNFITDNSATIELSEDTLKFDTVFTSVGSITQFFKIRNTNNQKLLLNSVSLVGGNSSFFKINVDGIGEPVVNNIEIAANDSIYAFVTVNINPSDKDLPFIIRDSIEINYNGNTRFMQLEAWGQNAIFFRSKRIAFDETWINKRPYVITGEGLLIDKNATLTIEEGTRIYVNARAPIIVDGTIIAKGRAFDSTKIYFLGDRLDNPYKDFPGGWPGIFIRSGSINNSITHTVIKNAFQGVIVDSLSTNAQPKLILNESIIDNCFDIGIGGINSSIQARNCLISNCGKNIALVRGGNYDFTHCTVASIGNRFVEHKDPVLTITNCEERNNITIAKNLTATFTNCIFYGTNGRTENEIVTNAKPEATFQSTFNNCLVKYKTTLNNVQLNNVIINEEPLFDSINIEKNFYNFRLKENSPAINKGIGTSVNKDMDNKPRVVGSAADIGAYEKQLE